MWMKNFERKGVLNIKRNRGNIDVKENCGRYNVLVYLENDRLYCIIKIYRMLFLKLENKKWIMEIIKYKIKI